MLNNQFYNQNELPMPTFFIKLIGGQVCLHIDSKTEN